MSIILWENTMNKKKIFSQEFKKNKYKYIFLITIVVLGFITGIIFSNILSYNDQKEISEIVKNYFLNIKRYSCAINKKLYFKLFWRKSRETM